MAPTCILVVDDDPEIVRLLRAYLEQATYRVITALDASTARALLHQNRPALMVLDLMLPDGDGFDIMRALRSNSDVALANLPVIMLTARVEDTDKIVGLELGADDYITKPFNPREVVARVRGILRRSQVGNSPLAPLRLECGALHMDLARRMVTVADTPIDLTPTEYDILRTLMEQPGFVFTRASLIEHSLGYDSESLERSLDTHIKNLRRKIEIDPKQPEYIQTVYGVGYRLEHPKP